MVKAGDLICASLTSLTIGQLSMFSKSKMLKIVALKYLQLLFDRFQVLKIEICGIILKNFYSKPLSYIINYLTLNLSERFFTQF